MKPLASYAAYRHTRWRFSIVRMMIATALVAVPFAAYHVLPAITFIEGWALYPIAGACWGSAVGFLRDGPVGLIVGAIIGATGLVFSVILLAMLLVL